ncbi:CLIP domain-containing serine protease B4-like [Macrobrachium rosenbergii]|uniref:CLIP domain-containing serine protease B4-like n=1 Tax=Macrobrachium rosenbergii TaxID=79674 RepID=UPI0034D71785
MAKQSGGIVGIFAKFLLIFALVIGGKAEDESRNCSAANGEEGSCVPLHECPLLHSVYMEIINGTASSNTSQEFERSFCPDRLLLCCPASELSKTPDSRTSLTDSAQFLLPEDCGFRALSDRIVNGDDASLFAWPWIALLRGRENDANIWFCGGTLISDRYVLTAAHCFTKNPDLKMEFVRIGEHDLSSETDCEDGICAPAVQDIEVENIILHPRYKVPCEICNDIALLRLSTAVEVITPFVNSVCLPVSSEPSKRFSNQKLAGTSVWAAGWGMTNPYSKSLPNVLQEVEITVQEDDFCTFRKRDNPYGSTAFCAGGRGKDTCKGDSGGPVTTTYWENQRVYLIGITSAGSRHCGSWGIYVNVYQYVPWILSNMKI